MGNYLILAYEVLSDYNFLTVQDVSKREVW